MDRLLASHPDVVVSGTVPNQGRFYDRFKHVVLLSAPVDVLLERTRTRTNNPTARHRSNRPTSSSTRTPSSRCLRRRNAPARRTPTSLRARRHHREACRSDALICWASAPDVCHFAACRPSNFTHK